MVSAICRAVLVALVCVIAFSQRSNAQCGQSQYISENQKYTNELKRILITVYQNLQRRDDQFADRKDYLKTIEDAFSQSFRGSSCSYRGTTGDIVSQNQYLADYLQGYTYRNGGISSADKQKIISITRKAEDLIRELLKYRNFAQCFVNKVRDAVIDHIVGCVNRKRGPFKMQVNTNQLDDIPIPDLSERQFAERLFAFVVIWAKGFLQVANCPTSQIPPIVGKMSSNWFDSVDDLNNRINIKRNAPGSSQKIFEYFDMCDATDALNNCICRFPDDCSDVMGCFEDMVDNFGTIGPDLFHWESWTKTCGRVDTSGLSTLIGRGLSLYVEMRSVVKNGNPSVRKEIGEVVKTIVKSNFNTDSCGCQHASHVADAINEQC